MLRAKESRPVFEAPFNSLAQGLQARTGQLEARLDSEIEQLNDELVDSEKARSAMDDRRPPRPKPHVGR